MYTQSIKNFALPIVYCGGTISAKIIAGARSGGRADFKDYIEKKNPKVSVTGGDTVYDGLSENINKTIWSKIAAKIESILKNSNPKSILVTHGTDSMEQTARYLQQELGALLKQKNCRIILTGANDDLSHPKTDAWKNINFSVKQAQNTKNEAGVYIAFQDRFIPADQAIKEPFDGKCMKYTFKSDRRLLENLAKAPSPSSKTVLYEVNQVRENHEELLKKVKEGGVKAVLMVLYHSGTANTDKNSPQQSVAKLTERLRQDGVTVFAVTENGEPTDLSLYETSVKLKKAGVVPLYDMTKADALNKLDKLSNKQNLSRTQMIDEMLASLDPKIINWGDINSLKKLYSEQ